MGRFYKTASANPLDYMYKLNTPLMERVVAANDQFIDNQVGALSKLDQLANFNHLIGDDEDAKAITDNYRKQVDELTKQIQNDPANWRKQLNPLRALTKDLQSNYESGAISKLMYNYTKRKTDFDAVDKQVEQYHKSGGKSGISPERAAAYKAHWDAQFDKTGYDPSSGKYNTYKGGTMMDDMDVKKILSEGLDKLKADKNIEYHSNPAGNDWYIDKTTNKRTEITPERVLQIASDNINPRVLQYLAQDSQVGLLKGVYDEGGKYINPYSYKNAEITPDIQKKIDAHQAKIDKIKDPNQRKQMQQALDNEVQGFKSQRNLEWNEDSYFTPILRGLVNTYAYKEVESGNDLKSNSKGSTIYTQAHADARNRANIASREKVAKDRLDYQKERDKQVDARIRESWEHMGKGKGTGTGKAGTTATTVNTPETTGVVGTRSFEDYEIIDDKTGKPVNVLSNAGLVTKLNQERQAVDDLTKQIKDLDTKLGNHNLTEAQKTELSIRRSALVKQKGETESSLAQTRNWYKSAVDAVLENNPNAGVNLSASEKDLYKKWSTTDIKGENYKKELTKLYSRVNENTLTAQDLAELPVSYYSDGTRTIEVTGEPSSEDKAAIKQATGKDFSQFRKVTDPSKLDATNKQAASVQKNKYYKDKINQLNNDWTAFQNVKDKVDQGRDNFLKSLRTDVITSKGIQPSTKDSKDVADIILANTHGSKIYDNNSQKTAVKLNGKSWYNGDDELTFDDSNRLLKYIKENNVEMKVLRVAPGTKLDNAGAVAEVQFNDPTGRLDKGVHYITLNPEVQKTIAKKFMQSKSPDILGIASLMGDSEYIDIKNQMVQPTVGGNKDVPFTIYIKSTDGHNTPLKVTRLSDGNKDSYHIEKVLEDGKTKPFLRANRDEKGNAADGIDGFFDSIEDFYGNLALQKASK